jgi:hypothetical protein
MCHARMGAATASTSAFYWTTIILTRPLTVILTLDSVEARSLLPVRPS